MVFNNIFYWDLSYTTFRDDNSFLASHLCIVRSITMFFSLQHFSFEFQASDLPSQLDLNWTLPDPL